MPSVIGFPEANLFSFDLGLKLFLNYITIDLRKKILVDDAFSNGTKALKFCMAWSKTLFMRSRTMPNFRINLTGSTLFSLSPKDVHTR